MHLSSAKRFILIKGRWTLARNALILIEHMVTVNSKPLRGCIALYCIAVPSSPLDPEREIFAFESRHEIIDRHASDRLSGCNRRAGDVWEHDAVAQGEKG